MNFSRPLIARFCPLFDLIIASFVALNAPEITNFFAPIFQYDEVPDFNIVSKFPMLTCLALLGVPIILNRVGFYRRNNLQTHSRALHQLCYFMAYCLSLVILYEGLHMSHLFIDRVIVISITVTMIALYLRYAAVRFLQINTRLGEQAVNRVLLIGTEEDIEQGWADLSYQWKVGRNCTPLRAITGQTSIEQIQEFVEHNSIEAAFVFGKAFHNEVNKEAMAVLGSQGIDINRVIDRKEGHFSRVRLDSMGKSQVLVMSSGPEYTWTYMFKGLLDRLGALIILICSSPLWLIAAIGIKISDPAGKIFYKQQRSGLYGKPFGMWKFRSMYSDADQRLDEIKAEYGNEVDGPIFKLTDDPRVFKFGRFIRKTSIDELPQLLNILMGDMSIVGPRPLPVYETAEFTDPSHRRRLSVKPGLTCYWQVEDRSDATTFEIMIQKDLKYIDNWSLWLDLCLFLRTIPAVLFGKGAK